MRNYAAWYGQLGNTCEYAYQPLDGDHDAVGDCLAMIARLRAMAPD